MGICSGWETPPPFAHPNNTAGQPGRGLCVGVPIQSIFRLACLTAHGYSKEPRRIARFYEAFEWDANDPASREIRHRAYVANGGVMVSPFLPAPPREDIPGAFWFFETLPGPHALLAAAANASINKTICRQRTTPW